MYVNEDPRGRDDWQYHSVAHDTLWAGGYYYQESHLNNLETCLSTLFIRGDKDKNRDVRWMVWV